jgi:hypothetical protein
VSEAAAVPGPASAPAARADAFPRPPASIVPLAGLPFVAAALGLLIGSIASDWTWGLNFCHVAGGGAWTAIDLFVGLVVGPIVGRMSPQARAEFSARFMPKMLLLMPTLVTLTLASGFQLARHFGFLDTAYPRHPWIVASYFIVGLMFVIAIGILEPANIAVLFEMRKPQPSAELIGRLMRRFIYTAGIIGLLQLGTLIVMTHLAV